MKKITLIVFLLAAAAQFAVTQFAFAITPFTITDIRVEGLERLEVGTVFNYLPLKVGDEVNDEETRLSIKELFKTGFFKEVSLGQDGTVLVVTVVERPSIASITFKGNDKLKDDALKQGLEQAGMVEGRIFNSANLERVEQEIKNSYLSMGRYSATVQATIEELDQNRVAITMNINEGRVARIKKINIIGAETVSVKKIKDEMQLKEKRGLRLFSRRDQYSKQKLEADIESIRSYYLNRGYHEFEIVSSNVEISPNKQNIFIGIVINEGALYTFGETVIEGVDQEQAAQLQTLITIESGKPFSRQVVSQSRVALTGDFVDAGFAFVEVRSTFESDAVAKVVDTIFSIIPKQRVYVRRIDISGNVFTRDEVIRRELRQFEGAWYSASAIRRSKGRLSRLGIFASVQIETPPVAGTTDQVDMKVIVSERDTGSILVSAGYSDEDGPLFGVEFTQRNLLGIGRHLSVKVNDSDAVDSATIAYTNPYHTPDGISRGFTLTTSKVDADEVDTASYVLNTSAVGVLYKIPIAETNTVNLGLSFERLELDKPSGTPASFAKLIDAHPKSDNLVASVGLSKDTRDDFFFPTRGATRSISLEASLPGSDLEYYKFNVQGAYYQPLGDRFTIKGSLGLGYGDGYGNSKDATDDLPFFKNYFAGGARSVRGYNARSLGPREAPADTVPQKKTRTTLDLTPTEACADAIAGKINTTDENDNNVPAYVTHLIANCEPIGGSTRVLASVEALFPAFGADSNDKRLGLFVDGGIVYESTADIDLGELRYTAGVFFNWYSAIGPFSISYGVPLNEESGDDKEKLQISIGAVFR